MDIITFYNEIFIPAAKPLLVDVGSAGTTVKASNVPEVGNNKDGIVFFFKNFSVSIVAVLCICS